MLLIYLWVRGFWGDVRKIILSFRIDLFLALCFGIGVDFFCKGLFGNWYWYSKLVTWLKIQQLLVLVLAPLFLGVLLICRYLFSRQIENPGSYLIPDQELMDDENDLLGFNEKAKIFADRVYNNGTHDSYIFGVDAPWGVGKSSFVNFCIEYWKNQYKKRL